MKITIRIPFIYFAHDVSYLYRIAGLLRELSGSEVKVKELDDEEYGGYYGVFYVGKCPDKEEIDKMYSMR